MRTDQGRALLFQPCQFIMEHARLISIAQKVIHEFGKDRQLTLCCVRDLFEGAQYNSEASAKCAVYSRARTKQGRGVIKEIR